MYYEIQGTGEPLILLHGGLGTIKMIFAELMPALAATRQVIAVELQAHGHTPDLDRPMTYEAMADDVAHLITELGLERADVLGFSLGGGVALQTAIRHPEHVNKLILISTPFAWDGWYPEVLTGMSTLSAESATMMLETPIYQFYAEVAPSLDGWVPLVTKLSNLLAQEYDWSAEIAALMTPTLLVYADADSITLPHIMELFRLLGGGKGDGDIIGRPMSQLAIIPGTVHINITAHTDQLLAAITPFLEAPLPVAS